MKRVHTANAEGESQPRFSRRVVTVMSSRHDRRRSISRISARARAKNAYCAAQPYATKCPRLNWPEAAWLFRIPFRSP
jgi:hypothetical protein